MKNLRRALRTNRDEEKSLALPPSFAEAHLPLRDHLGDGIYLLSTGELGVVYELVGIYDETLSESELAGALTPLLKFLRQIVVGIPSHAKRSNIVVQLICSQRQVSGMDTAMGPAPRTIAGEVLREEEERLFTVGMVKRRFILTVRYDPTVGEKESGAPRFAALRSLFKADDQQEADVREGVASHERQFAEALSSLEGEFRVQWPIRRWQVGELLHYYADVLHGANAQKLVFPEDQQIHRSIYTPPIKSSADGFEVEGGRRITPFVMSQLPEEYAPGLLRHFIDSLPVKDFDLVWGFSEGSRDFGLSLTMKTSWFSHGPSHKNKYADLLAFEEQIDPLRPHGVQSLRLLTYGISSEEKSRIQAMGVDLLGSRLIPERQIGVHMVVSSLPLCLSRAGNRIVGRYRQIRLENAASFWPIYDGPAKDKGSRWHVSRSLTPTRFDLFAGEGNRMTTVLGTSRAGKSCLMNQLLLEFMERFPDGVIRIIDKKTSYLKLADLCGGKIISFSESALQQNPYSPFAIEDWEEDDIEGIYVLLASAMVQKNPGIKFSSLHTELLRDALKIAYNQQGINLRHAANADGEPGKQFDPHPVWPSILAQLPQAASLKRESGVKGADEAREDLAAWSVSLGLSGQYGFIFSSHERPDTATNSARFLVYDLDGIADPVLQVLAAQMAFLKISRDLATVPRGTPKLIVFEELGMLLHGDGDAQKLNAEFIQTVVKTCAKLNAQAISLTNGVGDYTDKPAGRTLWTIATQKLFLPLGDAMVAELKDRCGGEFSQTELEIMASLEISRTLKRSELYVRSDNSDAPYRGTVFLPLSPTMDALVTSSGSQMELYQRLRREGKTPAEAMRIMAAEHPYGERPGGTP